MRVSLWFDEGTLWRSQQTRPWGCSPKERHENMNTLFMFANRANAPISSVQKLATIALRVLKVNLENEALRGIIQSAMERSKIDKRLNDYYINMLME